MDIFDKFGKGLRNPRNAVQYLRTLALRPIDSALTSALGVNVFDHQWDLLIILDGCRYDTALSVESSVLGKPRRIWSLGNNSPIWLDRTFRGATKKTLNQTAYITGNLFSSDHVPLSDLKLYDEMWRYCWDEDLSTIPPRPLTDQTIRHMRNGEAKRFIVHYMQPHFPPIPDDAPSFGIRVDRHRRQWEEGNFWRRVGMGEFDLDVVLKAYRMNLEYVLSEVKLLLENVSAEKVVITADHGNAFGEYGYWGHAYQYLPHPAMRWVPWWETRAIDEENHAPIAYEEDEDSVAREEKLESLGYL